MYRCPDCNSTEDSNGNCACPPKGFNRSDFDNLQAELERLRQVEADAIIVYAFYDASGDLQALSTNGGDEDWLAVFPAGWLEAHDGVPWWIEGGQFGACDVERHDLPDGRVVFIGSHA
jgi:hypothetical protein